MYFDAHCHLADPRCVSSLDSLMARANQAGVSRFIQGGLSPDDWERQLQLKARFPDAIVPVFGLHPWWVAEQTREAVDAAFAILETKLAQAAAIGELGLDALRSRPDLQAHAFEVQLDLGAKTRKPLVLHVVKAHEEAIAHLKRRPPTQGGIVHAFSSSLEVARQYMDLGLHLSIGAGVLRDGYQTLKRAVKALPAERIVIETDAPDGAGEPAAVIKVAEKVAELRGESAESVLARSGESLRQIFRMERC